MPIRTPTLLFAAAFSPPDGRDMSMAVTRRKGHVCGCEEVRDAAVWNGIPAGFAPSFGEAFPERAPVTA